MFKLNRASVYHTRPPVTASLSWQYTLNRDTTRPRISIGFLWISEGKSLCIKTSFVVNRVLGLITSVLWWVAPLRVCSSVLPSASLTFVLQKVAMGSCSTQKVLPVTVLYSMRDNCCRSITYCQGKFLHDPRRTFSTQTLRGISS